MGENGWADNRGTETLREVTGRKKGSPKEVRVGRKLPLVQMTLGEGPAGGGLDYEQPGEQKPWGGVSLRPYRESCCPGANQPPRQ